MKYRGVQNRSSVAGIGGSVIDLLDHAMFVNLVLRPAVGSVIDTTAYPDPLDFEAAAKFGVGYSALKVVTGELNQIIAAMRLIVEEASSESTSSAELSQFNGFFFCVYNHGLKLRLSCNMPFADNLEFVKEVMCTVPWDWAGTGLTENLSNLFLDLAVVLLPPSGYVCAGLWSDYDYLRSIFFGTNESNNFDGIFRKDNLSTFDGLGGFKYSPAGASLNLDIVTMQCYCVFKHIDFKRNSNSFRQSRDITPEQIFQNSKSVPKWVADNCRNLDLARFRSYGARLEFRVGGAGALRLFNFLRDPSQISKISLCCSFFPSGSIFGFMSGRIQAFNQLAIALQESSFKYTLEGLTLATMISYFFSGVMHRSDDSYEFRDVQKFLEEERSSLSACLFVANRIQFANGYWRVQRPFFVDSLERIFGERLLLSCSLPLVDLNNLESNEDVTADHESGINESVLFSLPVGNLEYRDYRNHISALLPSAGYVGYDILLDNDYVVNSIFNSLRSKAHFSEAQNILMLCRFSGQGVQLFSQLLMTELVGLYTTWGSRTIDASSGSTLVLDVGHLLLRGSTLAEYLDSSKYKLEKNSMISAWVDKLLLPSVEVIEGGQDFTSIAFLEKSSPWKKICSRAYFLLLVKNLDQDSSTYHDKKHDLVNFRKDIIEYIFATYDTFPKLAKDKIWKVTNNRLQFVTHRTTIEGLRF